MTSHFGIIITWVLQKGQLCPSKAFTWLLYSLPGWPIVLCALYKGVFIVTLYSSHSWLVHREGPMQLVSPSWLHQEGRRWVKRRGGGGGGQHVDEEVTHSTNAFIGNGPHYNTVIGSHRAVEISAEETGRKRVRSVLSAFLPQEGALTSLASQWGWQLAAPMYGRVGIFYGLVPPSIPPLCSFLEPSFSCLPSIRHLGVTFHPFCQSRNYQLADLKNNVGTWYDIPHIWMVQVGFFKKPNAKGTA
jgi:hypothetical protein